MVTKVFLLSLISFSTNCFAQFVPFSFVSKTSPLPVINLTISTSQYNYNIATNAGATVPSTVIVTINSGVQIKSGSAANPALTTGTLPAGSNVQIINHGQIYGAGGSGGGGGTATTAGGPGVKGGTAIDITVPTTINNLNLVCSGGGGGGGGGGDNFFGGGGGGGGAGMNTGSGGGGGGAGASNGLPGTVGSGGTGGAGAGGAAGIGGNGGDCGTGGGVGTSGVYAGGAPGAKGNAIKLNGNTYNVTGNAVVGDIN